MRPSDRQFVEQRTFTALQQPDAGPGGALSASDYGSPLPQP